jgi:hypothetical protein
LKILWEQRPTVVHNVQVSSSDDLLRLLIHDEHYQEREKHEYFQLLHGVYTSRAKKGLLLIGSRSQLLYGILFSYEDELLEVYGKVLEYCYETYFKIFYEPTLDDFLEEIVQDIIEHVPSVDMHSFWTNFNLWRALNILGLNGSNIYFTICPHARLIPVQNAHWNLLEGPSDMATKLLDKVEEKLGIRAPRTVATSRLRLLTSVEFHRGRQMITAKDNISCYVTLQAYHDAANIRTSLVDSLDKIIRSFRAEID